MTPDIVIIGGGPAGSASAIQLARRGLRVRLYEKRRFPRPKLCGGFLSPECLQDLDALGVLHTLKRMGTVKVRRSVIASQRGTLAECALPEETLSTSREVMDEVLLRQALQNGVDVHFEEDGTLSTVPRRYTVLASGRLTEVRHSSFSPWYAASPIRYFGMQAYFQNVDGVSDQVELDLVESGYVGLVQQQGQGVNLCALTTQEAIHQWGPSLDHVLARFVEENVVLKRHMAGATRSSPWMSVGPVRLGIRQLTQEDTFYVGDAACVMDPFAGEGMAMAMYGARLLANALSQTEASPQKAYERLWHRAFDASIRWNAAMRMLYSLPFVPEPILQALRIFPSITAALTELTRYRTLKEVAY